MTANLLSVAISESEVEHDSSEDPVICTAHHALRSSCWDKSDHELEPFYKLRHELSSYNNLLLRHRKLAIPRSLRPNILALTHEGHQGIVRTKQRLRQKVWWPRIDQDFESYTKHCHACQTAASKQSSLPLKMIEVQKKSWLMLGCDLTGLFPTDEYLLICVNYLSRYPEVEILTYISLDAVIRKLRKIFCRSGCPKLLVTDNGSQFVQMNLNCS